ncbi:phospholipase [Jeotgalibacillus soli]|uniref:phospholipase n=1 Tax=Jeotgalibacillus soli TaxID=889306 RepID=UPI000A002130|nr:phospholipase [Jeotgalibacillus soli]
MDNRKKRKETSSRFCIFPGYKWCGPGCSGPGAPINEVDAACKVHDLCYQRYGPSCRCDREFLERLRPMANQHSSRGRNARMLYNYIKLQALFTCGFSR